MIQVFVCTSLVFLCKLQGLPQIYGRDVLRVIKIDLTGSDNIKKEWQQDLKTGISGGKQI